MSRSVATLAEFLMAHRPVAVLTGAGVSTDSGIPDYRDNRGQWKRPPPMTHQKFMGSDAARRRYWARALVGFRSLLNAEPGVAHRVLATLEGRGIINGIITQNVDRLHQRAGSQRVIDLHGRADEVVCMSCGHREIRDHWHSHLESTNPEFSPSVYQDVTIAPDGDAYIETDFSKFFVPPCNVCNKGIMKPDVVFFGDNVQRSVVDACRALVSESKALWIIGSSLMVFSGYRFARQAQEWGIPVVCINQGHTRADDMFILKVDEPISPGLTSLLEHIDA